MDDSFRCRGGETSQDDIQILFQSGSQCHFGCGFLPCLIEASFRQQRINQLTVLIDRKDADSRSIVWIFVVLHSLESKSVAANLEILAWTHLLLNFPVEPSSREAHEKENHPHMHDVAAVTPSIPECQNPQRLQIAFSLTTASVRTAMELSQDRCHDEHTEDETNHRIEMPHAKCKENRTGDQCRHRRHGEVSLQALHRGFPPGEQWPDTSQEEEKEADRNVHLVVKRSADRSFLVLEVFRNDREDSAPQNSKHRSQQNEVVEQETAFS